MSYEEISNNSLQYELLHRKVVDQDIKIKKLQKQSRKQKLIKNGLLQIVNDSVYKDVIDKMAVELPRIEATDPDEGLKRTVGICINKNGEKNNEKEKITFSTALNKVLKRYKELRKLGVNPKNMGKNRKQERGYRKENYEMHCFYSGNEKEIDEIEERDKVEEDEYKSINWQYCLVFPNPDYNPIEYLPPDQVIELYDKCFLPDTRASNEKHQRLLENQTYYDCLELLQTDKSSNYFLNGGNGLNKSRGGKWKQYETRARDVQTLIRNITLYKLSKILDFMTVSFLSELGDQIYVLLSIDDNSLKKEAEQSEYPLQFQVGSTDLISMEPTNDKLVPLRYCNLNKPEHIKHLEQELRSFFIIIYENDLDSIMNQQVGETSEISDKTWNAYKEFLNFLNIEKLEILRAIKLNKDLKGYIIKKVYERALDDTYDKTNVKLINLWDHFQEKEMCGYFAYFSPDYDNPINVKKNNSYWDKSITISTKNEIEYSIFRNIDKLKLIYSLLESQFHLEAMVENNLLINYFPLHNDSYFEEDNLIMKQKIKETINDFLGSQLNCLNANEVVKGVEYNDMYDISEEDKQYAKQVVTEILIKKLEHIDDNVQNLIEAFTFSIVGKIPTNKIKNYLGEKLGMYYEFFQLYTYFLVFLGLFGIIVYIIERNESIESQNIEFYYQLGFTKDITVTFFSILYSFLIIIWTTLFIEYWKRKEKTLATLWGQLEFEETERLLPIFRGHKRRSPINDNLNELYSSAFIRRVKIALGYFVSLVIVALVIVIVIYLMIWKNQMVVDDEKWNDNIIASQIPSILNVVQIMIFNVVFNKIAVMLNIYENPKHFTQYEDSLASKIFIFQFINSYGSLFILGFFSYYFSSVLGGCIKDTVVPQLSTNNYCNADLSSQMMVLILCNFAMEILNLARPYFMLKFQEYEKDKKIKAIGKESEVIDDDKSFLYLIRQKIELQNGLEDFDRGYIDQTFTYYLNLIAQFGFVSLFSIAFQLTPLISYINNLVALQVDKVRLLQFTKRPRPKGSEDIGSWSDVLQILAIFSIFTNSALLAFNQNHFYYLDSYYKFIIFMCVVFVFLLIKIIISETISDTPAVIVEMQKRHKYVYEKLTKDKKTSLNSGFYSKFTYLNIQFAD